MKKILCLFLVTFVFLSLTGCKKQEEPSIPEENSNLSTSEPSSIDEGLVTTGTFLSKVITPLELSTTSCDIEISYECDGNILWKKTISGIPVFGGRPEFTTLQITKTKIFLFYNNAMHCYSTEGNELWVSDEFLKPFDNHYITDEHIYLTEKGTTINPQVDVYDVETGNFLTTVVFADTEPFVSPITFRKINTDTIQVTDVLDVTKYFDINTLKEKGYKDYTEKTITVSNVLNSISSTTESFPKIYVYEYKDYEIILTVSKTMDVDNSVLSEVPSGNPADENIITVDFLEEQVPVIVDEANNMNYFVIEKNGLTYALIISLPKNSSSADIATIASAFSLN